MDGPAPGGHDRAGHGASDLEPDSSYRPYRVGARAALLALRGRAGADRVGEARSGQPPQLFQRPEGRHPRLGGGPSVELRAFVRMHDPLHLAEEDRTSPSRFNSPSERSVWLFHEDVFRGDPAEHHARGIQYDTNTSARRVARRGIAPA